MNVQAILKSKGTQVETVRPDMSVGQVCRRLSELGIGALVVSADEKRVDGIVSERDVIRLLARDGANVLDTPVAGIMSRNVVTCGCDDNVAHLMGMMTEHRIRHLPVMKDEALVGIVSIGDVVKSRIRETEHEAEALREYIATG